MKNILRSVCITSACLTSLSFPLGASNSDKDLISDEGSSSHHVQTSAPLEKLPNELLVYIGQHLVSNELSQKDLTNLSLVSKQFSEIVEDVLINSILREDIFVALQDQDQNQDEEVLPFLQDQDKKNTKAIADAKMAYHIRHALFALLDHKLDKKQLQTLINLCDKAKHPAKALFSICAEDNQALYYETIKILGDTIAAKDLNTVDPRELELWLITHVGQIHQFKEGFFKKVKQFFLANDPMHPKYDDKKYYDKIAEYSILLNARGMYNTFDRLIPHLSDKERNIIAQKYFHAKTYSATPEKLLITIPQENADAQGGLGTLYLKRKEYQKAEEYLLSAQSLGNAAAINNLAHLYEILQKEGKHHEYEEKIENLYFDALKMEKNLRAQGIIQYNLAEFYETRGEIPNAKVYYALSNQNGYARAQEALDRLSKNEEEDLSQEE